MKRLRIALLLLVCLLAGTAAQAQRKARLKRAFWHKVRVRLPKLSEADLVRPSDLAAPSAAEMTGISLSQWGGKEWLFLYDYFGQNGDGLAHGLSSADLTQVSGTHLMNGILKLAGLGRRHHISTGPGIIAVYGQKAVNPVLSSALSDPWSIQFQSQSLDAGMGLGLVYEFVSRRRFSYSLVSNWPIGTIRQTGLPSPTDAPIQPATTSITGISLGSSPFTRVYLTWAF